MPFLPYARQQIDPSDIAAVDDVLRSDFLTTGPAVRDFETALASRLGARYAVSCSSGTAALHLACLALGLAPGGTVIVPATTFVATANAVRMVGADVVFADVDPDNGLITPETLEAALSRARSAGRRVTAAMIVHLAGQCPDMVAIAEIAARENLQLIEDACHAIGTYHACPDGSAAPIGACRLSRMAVFSFHPVKTIAAGEGGAVLTNDADLHRRLELFRCHGISREFDEFEDTERAVDADGSANPWYYEQVMLGWNYRLSDIHAALAGSQLARLQHLVEQRRGLAAIYDDLLAAHGRLALPIRRSRVCHPAWHLYPVLIDFDRLGISRAEVMRALEDSGVGSQVHYIPVHRQPYYRRYTGPLDLPGAEEYYRRTLSLPLFAGMTAGDVKRVVSVLHAALDAKTRRATA